MDTRGELRRRLREVRVLPPAPAEVPSWDEVVSAGREAGTAVSQALAEQRADAEIGGGR